MLAGGIVTRSTFCGCSTSFFAIPASFFSVGPCGRLSLYTAQRGTHPVLFPPFFGPRSEAAVERKEAAARWFWRPTQGSRPPSRGFRKLDRRLGAGAHPFNASRPPPPSPIRGANSTEASGASCRASPSAVSREATASSPRQPDTSTETPAPDEFCRRGLAHRAPRPVRHSFHPTKRGLLGRVSPDRNHRAAPPCRADFESRRTSRNRAALRTPRCHP